MQTIQLTLDELSYLAVSGRLGQAPAVSDDQAQRDEAARRGLMTLFVRDFATPSGDGVEISGTLAPFIEAWNAPGTVVTIDTVLADGSRVFTFAVRSVQASKVFVSLLVTPVSTLIMTLGDDDDTWQVPRRFVEHWWATAASERQGFILGVASLGKPAEAVTVSAAGLVTRGQGVPSAARSVDELLALLPEPITTEPK